MSIFKRGRTYWFHFYADGRHWQRSTKQGNPRVARQIEAAFRTDLAKGRVGIETPKTAVTLRDFSQRFIDYIQVRCAAKPSTISFYANKLARLLQCEFLAEARLNRIDEAMLERYVQLRRNAVAPASVNRELATLRRMLRLAQEWQEINRVPRIRMLPGERERNFVLSQGGERLYLASAPAPFVTSRFLSLTPACGRERH